MTSHEIRPKQLRTLLLLLVLVPLIPAALMVRFMLDTLRVEGLAALDRLQQLHGETLAAALRNPVALSETSATERATQLLDALKRYGVEGTTARVVDASGQLIAGEPNPWGQPLAQGTTPLIPNATIQLFLTGPEVLDAEIADQRRILVWTGVLTTLSVILIAGVTAIALHRQIALKDIKNTAVATVAHELRTPLASMRMLVDTLREGRYRGEGKLKEYLDLIANENDRLSRLAETFLTFSRLDQRTVPLQRSAVAPEMIIKEALAPLQMRLNSNGCEFSQKIAADLPPVMAERNALAQVLTNLLDNALKYTEGDKRIELSVGREGSFVNFAVKDNGIGIPEEERQAIFTPFYQSDRTLSRSREGSGLGLAIVRRIVDAHDGEITVASEPGKGSVFNVKIPTA
jgi:signal transduction histidine kinase